MQPSLTPVLLAIELGFLLLLARGHPASIRYWVWLVCYALGAAALGARGLYVDPAVLASLPGLWIQGLTSAAFVVPVLLFRRLREELREIADTTPWHWLAYFHALRIAALGTAYKTWIGEFPAYFELLVGVPDLLFGISALYVGRQARRGELTRRGFLWWNVAGALVIVPAAPIVLQLGLPGPLQIFDSLPDARAVFAWPMSIAPVFGVPLFVVLNLGVAWRLWERGDRQGDRRSGRWGHGGAG